MTLPTFVLVAASSFGLLFAQEPPAPPDLARELDLELADVRPWSDPRSAARVELVERKLARPGLLAGVESFRASGKVPGNDRAEPLLLLRLGLQDRLTGATLVCAVHADGRLAHAALGGRAEFDADADLAWDLFLGQMCSYGSLGPPEEFRLDPATFRTPEETASALAPLHAPGPDGELLAALVRQQVTMRGFTLLQRRLILLPEKPPPAAWLGEKKREFEQLASLSEDFELLLGAQGRDDHARRARAAATYLGELEELARAAKSAEFQAAAARMRGLCRDCHGIPAEDGARWDEAFPRLRQELALPTGLFRVGYDLAPALGDPDGVISRPIAEAVQALLLLAAGD